MKLDERLTRLEGLLDRLRRENANTPILVEGSNDRDALEELGCSGVIHLVHDGEALIDTADQLAAEHPRVILLLDWDRTGGSIHHRVKEILESHAVECDVAFRRELARLTTKETRAVEDIPSVLRHLRHRVGDGHPA